MIKTIVAIVVLGVVETVALMKGVDSIAFGLSVTAIAGLGGFAVGRTALFKKKGG